jgi:hypothetical protein
VSRIHGRRIRYRVKVGVVSESTTTEPAILCMSSLASCWITSTMSCRVTTPSILMSASTTGTARMRYFWASRATSSWSVMGPTKEISLRMNSQIFSSGLWSISRARELIP